MAAIVSGGDHVALMQMGNCMPEDVPGAHPLDCSRPEPRKWNSRAAAEYVPVVTAAVVAVGEFLAVLSAAYLAGLLTSGGPQLWRFQYAATAVAAAAVVEIVYGCSGLHNWEVLCPPATRLADYGLGACLGSVVFGLTVAPAGRALPICVTTTVLMSAAVLGLRWAAYVSIQILSRRGLVTRNVVIIGDMAECESLLQALQSGERPWLRVVGRFDHNKSAVSDLVTSSRSADFTGVAGELPRIDDIFVLSARLKEGELSRVLTQLRSLPANIHVTPNIASGTRTFDPWQWGRGIDSTLVIAKPLAGWNGLVKVSEDKIIAGLATILLLPVFILVATAVRLETAGPVLFRQRRYGFNGKVIEIYKFRTMYHDQRDDGAERLTRKGDPRITPLGRVLRRYGIDELPQLWNVLKGDMSVVGPRPHALRASSGGRLYSDIAERYTERYRVKPGITGWAQVNGWRGDTDTVEGLQRRVEFDIYYIEHWSIAFDVMIMLRTLLVIASGRGAC
jgi:polysaccharide biosynthesis protein PslA